MEKFVTKSARDIVRDLRYLISNDAERLGDYERINMFVKTGARAAAVIDDMVRMLNGKK